MNLGSRSSHKELDLSGHKLSMTETANCPGGPVCVLEHPDTPPIHKKRIKTNRCNHGECRKKLSIVDISIGHCKCSKIFCQTHRDASVHQCSYDWHTNTKSELVNQLIRDKCVKAKTERI
jgi:hypothetical protein